MAAPVRGDVLVTIGGEQYQLTPKFKAISAIELATGKGLVELLGSVAALHTNVIATVLFQALRADGFTDLSYEDVGEAVMDSISDESQPLVKAAVQYLNGFFPKKNKGEAAGGKKPVQKASKRTG